MSQDNPEKRSALEKLNVEPNDVLRGLGPDEIQADNEGVEIVDRIPADGDAEEEGPVEFRVEPIGEPQTKDTKYYLVDDRAGRRFYVGYVNIYHSRRGIARSSMEIIYDRIAEESRVGAWAHFIWPSIMAESNGRHLVVNAWDRAHFTWGFYQLAAHTPNDNLILLMRELLELPSAKRFFSDLTLDGGKVAQITPNGLKSLETEVRVPVGDRYELQIPDFMKYLNPSSTRVDNIEVVNAGKFIDWARYDPEMLGKTVTVSFRIMKKKVKRWANTFALRGKRPELAIWVSDMFHQGRATAAAVREALALPRFDKQLDALSQIDTTGQHAARREAVKRHVQTLLDEKRFEKMKLGEGALSFDEPLVS